MGLLDRAVDKLKAEQAEKPARVERAAPASEADAATETPGAVERLRADLRSDAPERVRDNAPADFRSDESAYDSAYDSVDENAYDSADESAAESGYDSAAGSEAPHGGLVDLGLAQLAQRGYIVPGYVSDGALLDEYRRIKRQLLFKVAVDQTDVEHPLHSNLIMITSAIDGEGKTFVSSNLAFSISQEMDRTALLIDADVVRRGASRLFGLEHHLGLIDYLEGDVDDITSLFVQPKGLENLRILPAGTPNKDVNELLASERMRDLMEELALHDRERVVLFDTPPILMTSEAQVIAQLMGQVVLVVRADETPQHHVENALGYMQPDRFAGLILNGASRNLAEEGYGGYYHDEGN